MTHVILSDLVASISEFKKHPMQIVKEAKGDIIAILNRNQPAFYCISQQMLEALYDEIEDARLVEIVKSRQNEEVIEVDIDDL